MKKNMLLNCFMILTLFCGQYTVIISCTPRLSKGDYKGTESVSISTDNKYWPGIINNARNTDTANRQWFHDVYILINGDSARIVKMPFYVLNGTKYLSDNDGGFYYYSGEILFDKDDKEFRINGRLDSCKFCPRLATAVPLYSHATYYIKKGKRKLIVSTDYETNLTFKKQ